MQQDTKPQGFTLLEMSIVLVIIGFIVSGVMVGRSLIRQSQLNSVATDVQKYKQAILGFQQKYGMLPGDFTNATTYWGASGGTSGTNYTSDCYSTSAIGSTATCNGNGDGHIGDGSSLTVNPATEGLLTWQHLANAGMISGQYTGSTYLPAGTTCTASVCPKAGVNIPASSIDGAGFKFEYTGFVTSDGSYFFAGTYNHIFFFGTPNTHPTYLRDPAISAVEAYSIDKKYDDGLPATGNIVTFPKLSGWTTCATTASSATAQYNITSTSNSRQCALGFITGF